MTHQLQAIYAQSVMYLAKSRLLILL
uniref:Uncharacterized protein n=1 Tax=Rhizophora mucronata TaxID=61149 RepID=A0A2P2PQZ0_RHIMU